MFVVTGLIKKIIGDSFLFNHYLLVVAAVYCGIYAASQFAIRFVFGSLRSNERRQMKVSKAY